MVRSKAELSSQQQEITRTILRADPASAAVARRFVSDVLANHGMESLVDTASLLASEVVNEALLDARSDLALEIEFRPSAVRILVRHAATEPLGRDERPSRTVPGRSSELLESLAEHWGSRAEPGGQSVWFELRRSAHRGPAQR